jgi:threonine aldolase
MDRIDYRSDTVSWPTPAMREAMANARVGDDVYGEDPTIQALEALAAEKVGKEAALFVASGTMGNLVSILSHATRGDEAIVGQDAHTFLAEAGGMSALGGIFPHPLATDGYGQMDLAAVQAAIHSDDLHYPRTRLILVENSYGDKNGYPLPPTYFAAIRSIAAGHGLAVHLDGARLFNAAVAQRIDAREITQHVDSVTFCLSKGLCAPVGSLVCGPADFIYRARRARKVVGGGMRQAGVLAAAGMVALCEMIDRLADDHHHAQLLAGGLAQIPGIVVQPEMIRTNIVFFQLEEGMPLSAEDVAAALRQHANIWLGAFGRHHFRAVTHYWIGRREVEMLLDSLREIMTEVASRQ